jgi:CheY-like chemotaxis protein
LERRFENEAIPMGQARLNQRAISILGGLVTCGATIWVDWSCESGSSMVQRLPYGSRAGGRCALAHGPAWERELRMARLLIAEDDHLMRWSLETSLGRDGHVVHSVDSGEAAIDAAMNGGYQVVITDYALPGPDGLHVLWHIKTRIPQTQVIVITGQATQELEKLARDMGAFDFLEKPFSFAALKGAVERALATPERRKGPRGCCSECVWQQPCGRWAEQETAGVS